MSIVEVSPAMYIDLKLTFKESIFFTLSASKDLIFFSLSSISLFKLSMYLFETSICSLTILICLSRASFLLTSFAISFFASASFLANCSLFS